MLPFGAALSTAELPHQSGKLRAVRVQCTYRTSLPTKSTDISRGRLLRAGARRALTSAKSATPAAPGWRLTAGVSNVSHDLAPNARRIPTAYGESCIFCFNRIRIGMHASNTKRDSIQTLLFVLVSQPARLLVVPEVVDSSGDS